MAHRCQLQALTQYFHRYNTVRLHSAIGYVTPHTKLAGKEKERFAQADQKLEAL
ncbi:MAG: integrase core domain-containing protein [Planctomycetota bacterium]